MYFEPAYHAGVECRDGGLLENNPVQLAVDEARAVWGSSATIDMVLSIGCGWSLKPQNEPASTFVLKPWLAELFKTLLATMNGYEKWKAFQRSTPQPLLDRCYRLNARFSKDEIEPELDDVRAIDSMAKLAMSADFVYNDSSKPFAPVLGAFKQSTLEVTAQSLNASLYFFELDAITQQDDVSVIRGRVCCRLRPHTASYRKLLEKTVRFHVANQKFEKPTLKANEYFQLGVVFQQSADKQSKAIRIDVEFEDEHLVAISGFPTPLEVSLQPNTRFAIRMLTRLATDSECVLGNEVAYLISKMSSP